jgi:hypothetical protein
VRRVARCGIVHAGDPCGAERLSAVLVGASYGGARCSVLISEDGCTRHKPDFASTEYSVGGASVNRTVSLTLQARAVDRLTKRDMAVGEVGFFN